MEEVDCASVLLELDEELDCELEERVVEDVELFELSERDFVCVLHELELTVLEEELLDDELDEKLTAVLELELLLLLCVLVELELSSSNERIPNAG